MSSTSFRGSRLHILDWVSTLSFVADLSEMVAQTGAVIGPRDRWMPVSHHESMEARLETFRPASIVGVDYRAPLRDWWLAHPQGANTPNWDLACSCTIGGRPGLILVEAKANIPELSDAGKAPFRPRVPNQVQSRESKENHAKIGNAIEEARAAIAATYRETMIGRDSHYQLSNRIAFAWKLAALGVPTVLVYLGFSGDSGLRAQLRGEKDWKQLFATRTGPVLPEGFVERRVDCGAAPFWLLVRHRQVLRPSPPAVDKRGAS